MSPGVSGVLQSPVRTDLPFFDLGRLSYEKAYDLQVAAHVRVLAAREGKQQGKLGGNAEVLSGDAGPAGELLLVEHDPVVTISNRASAESNLLASPDLLARTGVALARTDRGGDITYHGPGQLVAYPILDLNTLNLGLHDYMRLLEDAIIAVCARYGVETMRDPTATGVWTVRDGLPSAKIAAMGVRVRKWISMHGLALNVTTNLDHFRLIVPCGLIGRQVTSLEQELGAACPPMSGVKRTLVEVFTDAIERQKARAQAARASASQ